MKKALVTFISMTTFTILAEPTAYPLYCRGPFNVSIIESNSSLSISYLAGQTGAGPNGENLKPGTCAWEDRGLSSNEPITLIVSTLKLSTDATINAKSTAMFNSTTTLLSTASQSENQVIRVHAYNQMGFLIRSTNQPYLRVISVK